MGHRIGFITSLSNWLKGLGSAALCLVLVALSQGGIAYADTSYTVSGTLTMNSVPIAGATIYLGGQQTTTDTSGYYSIGLVPAGTYYLSIDYTVSNPPGTLAYPYVFSVVDWTPISVTGDTTKNLTFSTDSQIVHVVDKNNNPLSDARVTMVGGAASSVNGSFTFTNSNDGDEYYTGVLAAIGTTDNTGTTTVPVFSGVTYNTCASTYAASCQLVTASSTPVTVTIQLPAPTGLTAASPTKTPVLNWNPVSSINHYNIYRDGVKIDTTTPGTTTYTDTTATQGTHSYAVTAASYNDYIESLPSTSASVLVSSIAGSVTYYTTNDGSTFSRLATPPSSGISTQTDNSDGSVTVGIHNATGYADSGFTLYTGRLGDLPNFTVTGTGDQFGLNLWFDTSDNGSFFQWDSSGALTGLGGDTYGLSSGSSGGSLTVNGSTSFFMMDNGQNYTLSQLLAGNDTTSGIDANTIVTVWIGVDVGSGGSASTTITSIGNL